jgi:hypothetical protein
MSLPSGAFSQYLKDIADEEAVLFPQCGKVAFMLKSMDIGELGAHGSAEPRWGAGSEKPLRPVTGLDMSKFAYARRAAILKTVKSVLFGLFKVTELGLCPAAAAGAPWRGARLSASLTAPCPLPGGC